MTWLLFFVSVLASSASQYWQKRSALYYAEFPMLSLMHKVLNYRLLLAVLFLALSAMSWLGVLMDWSVAVAYPMLSLNFIIMLLVSKYAFGEKLTAHHWLGSLLVLAGVVLLGSSLS